MFYPDWPVRNGFRIETVKLLSDVVKKLQACGAFSSPSHENQPEAAPVSAAAATSAESYAAQGDRDLNARDYARALEAYKTAIALHPSLCRPSGAWLRLPDQREQGGRQGADAGGETP